jgi:3-methyladenine DNA glycosylase AlkD
MNLKETLAALKALSNEKMIALNTKNGAGKNQYGVKLGDIRTVANKVKSNHALALELWKTENVDARLLATLIIQPKKLSKKELDEMVQSVSFVQEADWLNSYVVKDHPERESLRDGWMSSNNVWAARAGWSVTSGRITRNPDSLDLSNLLDRIESEMPKAPQEVQWTMNTALAQIGINHPKLRKRAIDIGESLGVFRDYPVSKGCTSPFAPIWINEMVKRQG